MDVLDEFSTAGAQALMAAGAPLDLAIAAWLDAKGHRSGSAKTARAYRDTLGGFRAALQAQGLDLDGPEVALALAAQGWAGRDDPAPATVNQRLAILSSFFRFAQRRRVLPHNPIALVERRSVQGYAHAEALTPSSVAQRLAAIKAGSTPTDLRDYALLRVAVSTGRRVAELAALRWRDVRVEDERVTLTFAHTKGGTVMRDTLSPQVRAALRTYLQEVYGPQLGALAPTAAVWVALDANQYYGRALSARTLQRISQRRLGVHFHALRHTFARAMEDANAKVSEIQARLGHRSLQTTGRYLAALRSNENRHAEALDRLFGDAT